MTFSFHKLRTVSGAPNFTKCRKPKYELVVKFSTKNSKACGHEKYIKQITIMSRLNYFKQYTTVMMFKFLLRDPNMLSNLLKNFRQFH